MKCSLTYCFSKPTIYLNGRILSSSVFNMVYFRIIYAEITYFSKTTVPKTLYSLPNLNFLLQKSLLHSGRKPNGSLISNSKPVGDNKKTEIDMLDLDQQNPASKLRDVSMNVIAQTTAEDLNLHDQPK